VLSFLEHLTPADALVALRKRIETLDAEETRLGRDYEEFLKQVPRLFLVENEYLIAICRAERVWVESIVSDIESGRLVWSAESIKAIRAKLPGAEG
jgi:hypothetical protein